jgi:hypothetical protein
MAMGEGLSPSPTAVGEGAGGEGNTGDAAN